MKLKSKKKSSRKKSKFSLYLVIGFLLFAGYVLFFHREKIAEKALEYRLNSIQEMYGEEVGLIAAQYGHAPEYYLALIMLESSGRSEIPSRFEPHVYDELKAVQNSKRKRYEHVSYRNIKNISDEGLRNLASSWGPFQIMGYKCLELKITVADIRGHESIRYGMMWINKNYGKRIKKKQYTNAFHYHNTGRLFPKNGKSMTHDPNYITNGLKYMAYYRQKRAKESTEN